VRIDTINWRTGAGIETTRDKERAALRHGDA
jgi:hypothetical protein